MHEDQQVTENRLKVLVEVDDAFQSYGKRVWYTFRRTIVYVILLYFALQYQMGWGWLTVLAPLLWALYTLLLALRGTRKVLLRVSLDEASGMVTIETARFSTRKVYVFAKERVYIGAMMDLWARRMKANMIRIDVDRKTFFVQKAYMPWGWEQFETAGKIPRKL